MNGYLKTEKTRAILPMARILLRITSLRMAAASPYREHDQFFVWTNHSIWIECHTCTKLKKNQKSFEGEGKRKQNNQHDIIIGKDVEAIPKLTRNGDDDLCVMAI